MTDGKEAFALLIVQEIIIYWNPEQDWGKLDTDSHDIRGWHS